MKAAPQRAWLITPQAPERLALDYSSIRAEDLIIAVDGGFRRCLELGLSPAVIIGDFDSLPSELYGKIPSGCRKISHPHEKNETDTQLALQYCLTLGIKEVIICNNLAERFDHSVALVQNLLEARRDGLKASVSSRSQIVFLLERETALSYPVNSLLSLISLSESAQFLSSSGLQYPLAGLALFNWQSRGISNVCIEPTQSISLQSGTVLAVLTLP